MHKLPQIKRSKLHSMYPKQGLDCIITKVKRFEAENLILTQSFQYLQVVFPDFGGPIIAICTVTIGLGEGCFKYFIGQLMNADLAFSDDR